MTAAGPAAPRLDPLDKATRAYVNELVAAAPPLSDVQRDRLRLLFRAGGRNAT
ncbi:MAG: hypothetical protein WBW75_32975 [Mycobacterium sp.]|uniref:hypothetical protein n=1 Tax=Mycobacterium sp. TaxID=1785 RepID=UPI003C424244